MVSDKDREHFRRIAAIEAELNDDAVRRGAARSAGDNIALGFDLSEFAASFGGDISHLDEVPLIQLWRDRERRTRNPR